MIRRRVIQGQTAAVRVIVTFAEESSPPLLTQSLLAARIASGGFAWRFALHSVLWRAAEFLARYSRTTFLGPVVSRLTRPVPSGEFVSVHQAQYVPSAAMSRCNHAFFTAGIFNPRLSQIGIDFTLVGQANRCAFIRSIKNDACSVGRDSRLAKLQIPSKQIIPVVINGDFIIFILNYLTVLQGKIIALSLMLLWFGGVTSQVLSPQVKCRVLFS